MEQLVGAMTGAVEVQQHDHDKGSGQYRQVATDANRSVSSA